MFSSSSSPPFGRRSASFLSLIPNTGDGSGIEAVADAAQVAMLIAWPSLARGEAMWTSTVLAKMCSVSQTSCSSCGRV
jgi:hypothetical protein